jgi:hypothetical protein
VCAARRAADTLVRDRYLLPPDADRLVADAARSALLPSSADATLEARRVGERLCR